MKVYVFLIMFIISVPGFTQDKEVQETDPQGQSKIPEVGTKVLPQEQEENSSIPNPFQTGPYEAGKYIYADPEDEESPATP